MNLLRIQGRKDEQSQHGSSVLYMAIVYIVYNDTLLFLGKETEQTPLPLPLPSTLGYPCMLPLTNRIYKCVE